MSRFPRCPQQSGSLPLGFEKLFCEQQNHHNNSDNNSDNIFHAILFTIICLSLIVMFLSPPLHKHDKYNRNNRNDTMPMA
jgi:hypothetical protein